MCRANSGLGQRPSIYQTPPGLTTSQYSGNSTCIRHYGTTFNTLSGRLSTHSLPCCHKLSQLTALLCSNSGLDVKYYSYYDPSTCGLDSTGLYRDLNVCVCYIIHCIISCTCLCAEPTREVYGVVSSLCTQSNRSRPQGTCVTTCQSLL